MSQKTADWFRILWDLIQRGHNLSAISERTKIAHSTLRGYMQGSEPPHWRGEHLIAMGCQACDKRREDLPMAAVIIAPRVVRKDDVRAEPSAVIELERAWR